MRVRSSFERLREALYFREKQLLNQIKAIVHGQKLSLAQLDPEKLPAFDLDFSDEEDIKEQILNFGKLDLSKYVADDLELYKVEDYDDDYISFEKSLKGDDDFTVSNVSGIYRMCDTSVSSRSITLDESQMKPYYLGAELTNKSLEESPRIQALPMMRLDLPKIVEGEKVVMDIKDENCGAVPNHRIENYEDESDLAGVPSNFSPNKRGLKNMSSYSVQIQQWLQEILEETETEPIIYEIGQFSKAPYTRLCRNFTVET